MARSTSAGYQLTVTLRFTTDLPNGPYAIISGPARTAEVYINQDTSRTLADVKHTIEATAARVRLIVSCWRGLRAVLCAFSHREAHCASSGDAAPEV